MYNPSTQRIEAPFNNFDISKAIGCNSGDIGTLCTWPYIRKWARFKPEAIGGPSPIIITQRKANNFGLSANTRTRDQFIAAVRNGSFKYKEEWTMTLPTPYVHWLRMTDFEGYRVDSDNPFGSIIDQTFTMETGASSQPDGTQQAANVIVAMNAPKARPGTDDNTGLISASELIGSVKYADWHLGVALINKDNALFATQSAAVKNLTSLAFDFGKIKDATTGQLLIPAGVYTAVPYLADGIVPKSGTTAVRIVGIETPSATVTLETLAMYLGMKAELTLAQNMQGGSWYAFMRVPDQGVIHHFTGVQVQMSTTDSNGNPGALVQTVAVFPDFDLAENETWEKNGSFTIPANYSGKKVYSRLYTDQAASDWLEMVDQWTSPE